MSAQVYSYRRFSSPLQKKGGSLERQNDYALQIAREYGLVLNDDLIMTDEGLSAFHAEHVNKGALGVFIKAVDEGLAEKGSILIVESLDRLSREIPLQAQTQFNELITKGITIITANDNQVYNMESLAKDPSKLFISIAIMIRAHDESLTKQKRSVAFVKQQVRKFETEGVGDVAGSTPFWISRSKDGFELNKHAETARLIVDLYLNHNGLNSISRELADRKIQSPQKKRDHWGITTIRKVLDNKALFGQKKFKLRYLKDGKQVEEEYELDGYYPELISKEEYLVIQERRRKKSNSREAYGSVTYLLSSYGDRKSICSKCGMSVGSQLQKQFNRKKEYTQSVLRLHCRRHKESLDCCKSFKAERLERAFIESIHRELNADFLTSHKKKPINRESIDAQINDLDEQIENAIDILINVKHADTKKKLQAKLSVLEESKEELKQKLVNDSVDGSTQEDYDKLRELADKAKDLANSEERKLFKQILLQSLSLIVIDFESQSLTAQFHNGNHFSLNYLKETDSYQTVVFYRRKNIQKSK